AVAQQCPQVAHVALTNGAQARDENAHAELSGHEIAPSCDEASILGGLIRMVAGLEHGLDHGPIPILRPMSCHHMIFFSLARRCRQCLLQSLTRLSRSLKPFLCRKRKSLRQYFFGTFSARKSSQCSTGIASSG